MQLYALEPTLFDNNELDKDILYPEFIDHFFSLITESIIPPYAISIDGLWGSGKTTVMKIIYNRLIEAKYPVIWFNPWKYRQTENVVCAFLQCLVEEHKFILEEMEKSGKRILSVLIQSGMDVFLKVISSGIINLKDLKENTKFSEKESSLSFNDFKNTIKVIEDEFYELINCISKEKGGKSIVIFFDDLDRCLPDDAIKILEALKNLFVVKKGCKAIFICGIDTHIAKQFISKHYQGIEENFAINYFRKIFNLTISMPYISDIKKLLSKHIMTLFKDDTHVSQNSELVAQKIYTLGIQAQINSVRKYLNVITNLYAFLQFNPDYKVSTSSDGDFILNLLVLKESWQPLYENLIIESLRERSNNMKQLINLLLNRYDNKKQYLMPEQTKYLRNYLGEKSPFSEQYLSDWLIKYPNFG